MVLGPMFGALADRWSRKRCMVLADVAAVAGVRRRLARRQLRGDGRASPLLAGHRHGAVQPVGARRAAERRRRASDASPAIDVALRRRRRLRLTPAASRSARRCCSCSAVPTGSCSSTRVDLRDLGARARAAALRRGAGPAPRTAHPSLPARSREGLRATVGMRGRSAILLSRSAAGLVCARGVQRRRAAIRDRGAGRQRRRLLAARHVLRHRLRRRLARRFARAARPRCSSGAIWWACCCSALGLLATGRRAELRRRWPSTLR